MHEANALNIRNHLGKILDRLEATGEPVLISKGRRLRAVLVTPEDFEKRFLDYMIREKKDQLLKELKALKGKKKRPIDSMELIRQLRGYGK